MRRPALLLLVALLGLPTVATAADPSWEGIRAGVGVADATWHVGAGAGQYTEKEPPNPAETFDPHQHSLAQRDSYGVQSRLTIRAIVVEGTDGDRIALVKSDNYLAQNHLLRRVGQLLAEGDSGITPDQILHAATHNHSSPYYATPSWGVWAFQDAADLRAFEYQARAMAEAIEEAADNLVPARMGATTVEHGAFKANIAGTHVGHDGLPAGYPRDFGDNNVVVLRFDDVSGAQPEPLATWVNFGQHPESLEGYDLISADFLGPLERMVDRETGATMVFSQGDVGSAEGPYEGWSNATQMTDGVWRAWAHVGFAQTERGARLLADAVIAGWTEIGAGGGTVPYDSDFEVGAITRWFPGPVSHPYPSVSNCRTEKTVEGEPGAPVVGLPDCERPGGEAAFDPLWENLKEHGLPVPDHYNAPGFTAVEENARLHLQVFRLGDVVIASCACEAQVDLILNFESRADDVTGNIWDGFDWTAQQRPDGRDWCVQNAEGTWTCARPGNPAEDLAPVSDLAYRRMLAQIHNDAKGWDLPENAVAANSEPADPELIWGNFTKEELPPEVGYKLAVGVGHAGDYNGYTVSYREYMAYDHYRKALTAYGPHTADYMSTRMVRLAHALRDPAYQIPAEPLDAVAAADEARQEAMSQALGVASAAAFDGWQASLPDDMGPAEIVVQPDDIQRFSAAEVTWRGGSNALDAPVVRVERLVDGAWQPYADQSGEIVTTLELPANAGGLLTTLAGQQEWRWTATFEAFDGFPARFGQTPAGQYRFVIGGDIRQGRAAEEYQLVSQPFSVTPWEGIEVGDLRQEADGRASFVVAPIRYPLSYETSVPFVAIDQEYVDGGHKVCHTCSFRPWAETGKVATATVTVERVGGAKQLVAAHLQGDRWVTERPLGLGPLDRFYVDRAGVVDTWGEINGKRVSPGEG